MNLIKNLIYYSLIITFSLFISKSILADEFGAKLYSEHIKKAAWGSKLIEFHLI